MKVRNEKFPVTMKCAGSIFKNFLLAELPPAVAAAVPETVIREGKVPAAYFLEQVGAKGMSRGDIHVAGYHANLIYNAGGGHRRGSLRADRGTEGAGAPPVRRRVGGGSAIRRVLSGAGPRPARGCLAPLLFCAVNLHDAVISGNVEQVRALLAAGANANTRDALGATPLHDAAWTGNREIAALLIAHGADVNAPPSGSRLHAAAITR